jgi:hypothetical protein
MHWNLVSFMTVCAHCLELTH